MWEGGIWDTASTTTGTAGVGHDWKRADGYVYIDHLSTEGYIVYEVQALVHVHEVQALIHVMQALVYECIKH